MARRYHVGDTVTVSASVREDPLLRRYEGMTGQVVNVETDRFFDEAIGKYRVHSVAVQLGRDTVWFLEAEVKQDMAVAS